ncbi:MAG: lytic transglycosylase domain-containing protein, partial [Oligoflexia bacterium]|nr:lytic transglycosylase domain-containing protein [Oligoflexia bacterium]
SYAPAFPLKQLALIESYELCPFEVSPQFDPQAVSDWLKLKLAEAFYKRRKVFEQPAQTVKATVYLAENSLYKELRVSYLKHALILAKEQKNEIFAQKITQLLYKESPSLKPNPKAKDYFPVAQDFRKNRQFKQAVYFYIKVLNLAKSSFKEKNLSFSGLGRIYKIQRNRKKLVKNSEQWAAWLLRENTKQSLILYYKKQLELARQKWNLDENQKAIELISLLLKRSGSEVVKEDALYLRGLIYLQENQSELSLTDWEEALKILNKKKYKTDLMSKILWKKAWLFRQNKQYKKAIQSFKELQKINKNVYTDFKVLFWKGKTYLDLNQKRLAKNSFSDLIEKDHFGYYGLLARKILNKKPKIKKNIIMESGLFQDKQAENLIHWLALFKESELLSRFLETQKDEILNKGSPTETDWLKMIWLWAKAKQYLNIFQSLELMEDQTKAVFSTKYIYLLFPLDFYEEVETASQKWQVDKALIFSIIRQESAFNVRARSPADAFGLMQLIPSTARQTAQRNQILYRNFRDLYRPLKNILLGTAYIKSLFNQYNDSFPFAVSAYNAGSAPVDKWKEELKGLDTLEFIENIPYEETRTYVRLLIRNYVFYHNLLEYESENWFPNWLIR